MRRAVLLTLVAVLAATLEVRPEPDCLGKDCRRAGDPGAPADPGEGDASGTILGAPTAFDLEAAAGEHVLLEAETAIRPRPDPGSPILVRLDAAAEVPVVERTEGWIKVRYGALTGWVSLAPEEPAGAAPAVHETVRRRLFGGPDPEDVDRARRHLGEGATAGALGPYRLWTDVADRDLLDFLGRLAEGLPAIFEERFSLAAAPGEGETVVLFADDASYLDYVGGEDDPTLADSAGRAVGGLAVLAAGDRPPPEVGSILVHELTHLLTYRAFPDRELPTWLSEGLAEELAASRIRDGELLPGTLASWESSRSVPVIDRRGRIHLATQHLAGGPRWTLENLRERWRDPERPSLEILLVLPRPLFLEPERRGFHYPMSAFWVRYLLDEHRQAFLAFLAAAAAGGPLDAESLRLRLGGGWTELEASWGRWLRGRGPRRGPR